MNRRIQSGFTLIELLVVISIIGLLASIVLASLSSARAKARDAKRIADMQELQKALELYASDNNGSYPTTANAWWGTCSGFGSHGISGASGWVPNIAPTYMSTLPLDPNGAATCYLYRSNGTDYMLLAYQSVETFTTSTNKWPRPAFSPGDSCDPGNVHAYESDFAFYSSGARCW